MSRYGALCAGLVFISLSLFGYAYWIQSKAWLGQVLLNRAWQGAQQTQAMVKPWPWADSWPVAQLHVPRLDKTLIVLEGVSGEAMAFGPGRVSELSRSAGAGVFAVGGHRDSHLAFAQHLKAGDLLRLSTVDQAMASYHVTKTFVADASGQSLFIDPHQHALVLITCFPFNATQTGGSQRFVVVAEAVSVGA